MKPRGKARVFPESDLIIEDIQATSRKAAGDLNAIDRSTVRLLEKAYKHKEIPLHVTIFQCVVITLVAVSWPCANIIAQFYIFNKKDKLDTTYTLTWDLINVILSIVWKYVICVSILRQHQIGLLVTCIVLRVLCALATRLIPIWIQDTEDLPYWYLALVAVNMMRWVVDFVFLPWGFYRLCQRLEKGTPKSGSSTKQRTPTLLRQVSRKLSIVSPMLDVSSLGQFTERPRQHLRRRADPEQELIRPQTKIGYLTYSWMLIMYIVTLMAIFLDLWRTDKSSPHVEFLLIAWIPLIFIFMLLQKEVINRELYLNDISHLVCYLWIIDIMPILQGTIVAGFDYFHSQGVKLAFVALHGLFGYVITLFSSVVLSITTSLDTRKQLMAPVSCLWKLFSVSLLAKLPLNSWSMWVSLLSGCFLIIVHHLRLLIWVTQHGRWKNSIFVKCLPLAENHDEDTKHKIDSNPLRQKSILIQRMVEVYISMMTNAIALIAIPLRHYLTSYFMSPEHYSFSTDMLYQILIIGFFQLMAFTVAILYIYKSKTQINRKLEMTKVKVPQSISKYIFPITWGHSWQVTTLVVCCVAMTIYWQNTTDALSDNDGLISSPIHKLLFDVLTKQ